MEQITLYDLMSQESPTSTITTHERIVAIICLTPRQKSTAKGAVLYVTTETDAQKICSDPRTRSNNPTREWMYAYTGYWKDAFGVDNWQELAQDRFRRDDGRFDELFEELGVNIIFSRR